MSRARMTGILASLTLTAGVIAGCGAGGGSVAEQSAPATTTTPATTTPVAAPTTAEDPTKGVVKAIPAEDPKDAHFKRFDEFPMDGASRIFVAPSVAQTSTSAAAGTGGATGTTGGTTTTPTTTTPSTSNVRTNAVNVAQGQVDGKSQTLQVGTQIPTGSPMFTVQSIDTAKVTLKLNSGTFPGGSNTIDIAAGASVTLSNPTTGAAIFILVRSILPVAT